MTRLSDNQYDETGRLLNGYDYSNQAWVKNGRYIECGHPGEMNCRCYSRLHAGEEAQVRYTSY